MSYREELCKAMSWLGEQPNCWAIGYNTKYSRAGGTLQGFPGERIIEMPLAEALMTGVAIGLSLDGRIPLLWFERCDFLTLAMDQIVNHLSKLKLLSSGIHSPAVLIRCVVGNKDKPLFTGPTHCQNFSRAFLELVDFPVIQLQWESSIMKEYEKAYRRALNGTSTMLVEFKDYSIQ